MALEVPTRRVGSGERAVEIIDVIGRLDTPGGAHLRSVVQNILKEGSPRIAVNLTKCVEIHRETTGSIHSLARACKRAGGGLVIFGASGDVHAYIKRFVDPNMAPWYEGENEAIRALGGEPLPEKADKQNADLPVVVALGTDRVFRKLFWKLGKLGGKPLAKFDDIESGLDLMTRRNVHSVIIDSFLNTHDVAKLLRRIKTSSGLRDIGIIVVGPPSMKNVGRALINDGATYFVPYVFKGEEIVANLEAREFFNRLKEVYERFEASRTS